LPGTRRTSETTAAGTLNVERLQANSRTVQQQAHELRSLLEAVRVKGVGRKTKIAKLRTALAPS
jgi:hypothetical protein